MDDVQEPNLLNVKFDLAKESPEEVGPARDDWAFFHPKSKDEEASLRESIEVDYAALRGLETQKKKHLFDLADSGLFLKEGIQSLVTDDFTKCFERPRPDPWNWNPYLMPVWMLGVFVRYCVLFPLRLTCLVIGTSIFAFSFFLVTSLMKEGIRKRDTQRSLIKFLARVWLTSWSAVVRVHGVKPKRQPNQIFVANHSTIFDVALFMQDSCCAVVGQAQKGALGFIQTKWLSCLGCIWFNRSESKDREMVARTIKTHIANVDNNPLLLFPEGTCVNNEYCIMFKKGAFELGATVCPVAIKYNKIFVDAYWHSRKQGFAGHVFRLLTCWAMVVDVYYLEPQSIRPGEDPVQFAGRVKEMIAKKAKLISVPWDGYLKYFKPSPRFLENRQKKFSSSLLARYSQGNLVDLEKEFLHAREERTSELRQRTPSQE